MSEPTRDGHLTSDLEMNDATAGTSGRGTQRRQQRGTINANHLLNFQSNAREARNESTAPPRRRPQGGASRSSRSSRPAAYDRTKFLQANFRFMISDASEIQKYEADPDLMLNWDDVAAVDVITSSSIQCPITLGPPLCPCITPCGHIFSEEAIMAHMMTQGGPELKVSSACPVCTTQITARELRPVTVRHVTVLGTRDRITLRLLKRKKDSIIPHLLGEDNGQEIASEKEKLFERNSGGGGGGGGGESDIAAALSSSPSTTAAATAAAWKKRDSSHRDKDLEGKEGNSNRCNPYAKFTATADPMPLWSNRVRILSRKAAQLRAEGGLDATYEVPPILGAIDAMANRARAWVERRQRLLIENLDDDEATSVLAAGGLAAAELAGKEAMAALKRVSEEASIEEEKVYKKSVAVHALEEAFPALSVQQKATTTVAATIPTSSKVEANQQISTGVPPQTEQKQVEILPDSLHSTLNPAPADPASTTTNLESSSSSTIYFYQSIDGQLVFLCPLNMKMLADWAGSYTSLPHEITAPVLELEEIEQTEATRRRLKSCCGHLPLGGSFKLCEIDMSELLPEAALAPFEAELTQREKKRVQIAKLEAKKHHREAAKAKSMAAAKAAAAVGPSAAELAAMPLPGAAPFNYSEPVPVPGSSSDLVSREDDDTAAAEGASPSSSSSFPGGSSAGAQPGGISFARIAKLGFAATGPALGEGLSSPPTPPWGGNTAAYPSITGTSPGAAAGGGGGGGGVWPVNQSQIGGGAWGTSTTNTTTAWGTSTTNALPDTDAALSTSTGGGGKKKGKKMLLMSTSQRRY